MNKLLKRAFSGAIVALALSSFGVTAFASGQIGTVTASTLNVRESASTSAPVVTQIHRDGQVVVVDSADGWYKVSFGVASGWVSAKYLSVTESNSEVTSRGSSLGSQIVSYAKNFMGTRYVWGGSSSNGVDCSGFVKLVYNNFGINVNRVAADQAKQGTYVSTAGLNEGDLLFFATSGGSNINHVGIYIGNGKFIHASSGAGKVTVSDINSKFYSSHFITARTLTR